MCKKIPFQWKKAVHEGKCLSSHLWMRQRCGSTGSDCLASRKLSVQTLVMPRKKERKKERKGGRKEGRKKGREDGRKEGRKEGRVEGRKEGEMLAVMVHISQYMYQNSTLYPTRMYNYYLFTKKGKHPRAWN
jgi:hypothetical protein